MRAHKYLLIPTMLELWRGPSKAKKSILPQRGVNIRGGGPTVAPFSGITTRLGLWAGLKPAPNTAPTPTPTPVYPHPITPFAHPPTNTRRNSIWTPRLAYAVAPYVVTHHMLLSHRLLRFQMLLCHTCVVAPDGDHC